jgi:hypothetical protein
MIDFIDNLYLSRVDEIPGPEWLRRNREGSTFALLITYVADTLASWLPFRFWRMAGRGCKASWGTK